ncbi:MAG: DUF2293 domain-containing protein [Nitriliruptor sp.]|uniref:DUF2293 domain-containing protein n=1 Tax=Nitriliruptor sp. TaxID=2448056 RepID=UPI0034A0247E
MEGLRPSETVYVARARDRRALRFSVSGDPALEASYRTHWESPDLSAQRKKVEERASAHGTPSAKVLAPATIELAVAASVRHRDTSYDALLTAGVERTEAQRPRTVQLAMSTLAARRRDQRATSTATVAGRPILPRGTVGEAGPSRFGDRVVGRGHHLDDRLARDRAIERLETAERGRRHPRAVG